MTSFYLGLALLLALNANAGNAWLRVAARLLAAVAMGFLAWSIVLANQDGTFAQVAADNHTPLLLNIEGGLIGIGALLLLASIPAVLQRPIGPLPLRSDARAYGRIARGLHWAAAALIIPAFTMGQFITVLAPDRVDTAEFLGTHMLLGLTIAALVMLRLIERLARPAPANPMPVRLAHGLLYALLIAMVATGLALAPAPVLGFSLPPAPLATWLHRVALPLLLGLLFAGHLAGAVKAIRRMAA